MDIKVKARLSAYSKVDSMPFDPHTFVTDSMIDDLFKDSSKAQAVSKEQIDTLFASDQPQGPQFPEDPVKPNTVSFAAIDSLFR